MQKSERKIRFRGQIRKYGEQVTKEKNQTKLKKTVIIDGYALP